MSRVTRRLRTLLCRAFGHRWGWPDIIVLPSPFGLRFLPMWRTCDRCGRLERANSFPVIQIPVPVGLSRDSAGRRALASRPSASKSSAPWAGNEPTAQQTRPAETQPPDRQVVVMAGHDSEPGGPRRGLHLPLLRAQVQAERGTVRSAVVHAGPPRAEMQGRRLESPELGVRLPGVQ